LTFIPDPAAQSLVKAFLKAIYMDEFITQCEDQFGFVRVGGELREKALNSIDALVTSSEAPAWSFEIDTEKRVGQGDYVLSAKRKSYSELEQASMLEKIDELAAQVEALEVQNEKLMGQARETSGNSFGSFINDELDEDSQVKVALVMSSISIGLWGIAILALLVKYVSGGSGPNAAATASAFQKSDDAMETGMN